MVVLKIDVTAFNVVRSTGSTMGISPSLPSPPQPPYPAPPVPPPITPPSPGQQIPKYPAISMPADYLCLSFSAGKVLGVIIATGGLQSATTACNHRIIACIIDYESSGNSDGNFGGDGGCIAQLQGKLK